MGTYHTIKQGEHLARLAKQSGFLNYNKIWMAAENADLRKRRPDPNVLYPGDVLFIPDRTERHEKKPTDQVHTFKVDVLKLKLRMTIRDFDNLPVSGLKCSLTFEGNAHELTTNGDGLIEKEIPAHIETAALSIPELDLNYDVHVGHIDPVDEDSGWQARLINLGYYWGNVTDPDEAERIGHALEEFQCDYKLPITGKADAATRAKLKEVYGS